jgi:hypothetical protein
MMVLGGSAAFFGLMGFRRARLIEDTPRSKISSAPQGFCEFEGFAWPRDATVRTLDGHEAVYYIFSVEREHTTGFGSKRQTNWVEVFRYSHGESFIILDATGLAVIETQGTKAEIGTNQLHSFKKLKGDAKARALELVGDHDLSVQSSGRVDEEKNEQMLQLLKRSDAFNALTKEEQALLKDRLSASQKEQTEEKSPSVHVKKGLDGDCRIKERYICLASPLYATGVFESTSGGLAEVVSGELSSFRERVFDSNLQMSRPLKMPLRQGDRSRKSPINLDEFYSSLAMEARRNPIQEASPVPVAGVLKSSPDHDLFLATSHEESLVASTRMASKIFFVSGCAVMALAVAILSGAPLIDGEFKLPNWREVAIYFHLPHESKVEPGITYEQILAHHESCVAGNANSCSFLLIGAQKFQLSADNIKYYQERRCQLGGPCEMNERTPSSK